ncbi:MAG: LLM class flavin-dependent oxidoreductase [Deltaproteobacteria bacterium]|nr:LLM class flavin-dependent oxidoreductase [Deltaproteobacteria bacterium]
MPRKHRYWGLLAPMPAAILSMAARQCEDLGLEGIWAPQLWSPGFIPLGTAAAVTSRVKLGTGVVHAFSRSPLETACSALDLDLISGGRCVLGIGPTVRWWNEDWHGVHYGKPIPHLREAVQVIRWIIRQGYTGELGKWEGEYYQLNLDRFQPLTPPVRSDIPVYIPAVYEAACRLAGELADGLPGHPIWCERWILDRVAPAVAQGLSRAGRERAEFDLNIWLFVAPGPDKRECLADARASVAFYASFTQYERYFAACGFGDAARAIGRAAAAKDQAAMLRSCPDEMVDHFALTGGIDDIRPRLERIGAAADSFTLCVPFYGLGPDKVLAYNQRIAEAFYA